MPLGRRLRDQFDRPLFVTVAAIAVIGIVNLYSASSIAGPLFVDSYIQQIYWLSLGSAVAVLVVAIDYRQFERHAWVAYGIGIVLLVLVFLLGREVRGSQRWIPIGAFSLQPSELMKIFLIIALAKHLHDDPRTEGRTVKDLLIPGAILAAPLVLILKQPDLGTALVMVLIFAGIMFLTRLKLRSLLMLILLFSQAHRSPGNTSLKTTSEIVYSLFSTPRRICSGPGGTRIKRKSPSAAAVFGERAICRALRTNTAFCLTRAPTSRFRYGLKSRVSLGRWS